MVYEGAWFPEKGNRDCPTLTIEMFTYLWLSYINCAAWSGENSQWKRQALLDKVGLTVERSDAAFAGVETIGWTADKTQRKASKTNAFAKKDLGFFQNCWSLRRPEAVVELVETRLGNKNASSNAELSHCWICQTQWITSYSIKSITQPTGRMGQVGRELNFNRNQLVDKSIPVGTKVFYADQGRRSC